MDKCDECGKRGLLDIFGLCAGCWQAWINALNSERV